MITTQVPRGLLFLSSMTKPEPDVPSVAFLKFEDGSIIGTPSSSYAPATIPCAKSKFKRKSQRSSNFSEILVSLYGVHAYSAQRVPRVAEYTVPG